MSKTYKIGVVGAGNMGAGIAQKMAQEGLQVILLDLKEEYVQKGLTTIKTTLQQGIERKLFTPEQVQETLKRIKGSTSLESLNDVELVVEAIFENKEAKTQLFQSLDNICKKETIFATNTSSFFVKDFALKTNRPDRVIGMHYFYHPAKNRLLEVIPHEGTSNDTIEKTMLIGKLHGKTTILVKDSPGFAVNRFFVPFLNESVKLIEEGVANVATIDNCAKKIFGIGMGPFELMNVTGIPIAVHSSNTLGREISEFYGTAKALTEQMEAKVDWNLSGNIDESAFEAISNRLYATVIGVAGALVDEGIASIEDIDRGAKIGLAWRKGPFEIANYIGIQKTYQIVKKLADENKGFFIANTIINQWQANKPFDFKFVDLEIKNSIATITINRPEAMNALNPVVVEQLENKFTEAEAAKSVKAIVIQGAGKAFVAGADIKFFIDCIKNSDLENNYNFTKRGHTLLRRFETSSKLTIALLDGLSLGGGSEIALACQAIIATPQGSMGFPETGIGIYPGLGGMIRLNQHVGAEIAKYYIFTGKQISASDAYDLGIVQKLVAIGDIQNAIEDLINLDGIIKYNKRTIPEKFNNLKTICSKENINNLLNGNSISGIDQDFVAKTQKIIAKKAPLALRFANELIDSNSNITIDEAIALELSKLKEIFSTEDALLGLQSRPGNPPQFKGK